MSFFGNFIVFAFLSTQYFVFLSVFNKTLIPYEPRYLQTESDLRRKSS